VLESDRKKDNENQRRTKGKNYGSQMLGRKKERELITSKDVGTKGWHALIPPFLTNKGGEFFTSRMEKSKVGPNNGKARSQQR